MKFIKWPWLTIENSLFVEVQKYEEQGEIENAIAQFKKLLRVSNEYLKSKKGNRNRCALIFKLTQSIY